MREAPQYTMTKLTKIQKIIGIALVLVAVGIALGFALKPATKLGGLIHTLQEDFTAGIRVRGTEIISSTGTISTSALTVSGATTIGSTSAGLGYYKKTSAPTTDTTLTASQSGTTFFMGTAGLDLTLPAASASNGVTYEFYVATSFATTNMTIVSAEGDNVEGSLIVAGAVVDCDANDVITFVNDGENVGDFVELTSNGTTWYIGKSGALTTAKMTCSG